MTQPSNPNQTPSNDVWQWAYPRTERDKKRRILHAGGLGALGCICLLYVAVTAVTNDSTFTSGSRTLIVLGALLISLAAMGDTQTRRAHSTTMAINNLGLFTITDNKSTSSLDLRTSSVPEVRVRSGAQYASVAIEATAATGPWHRNLASVAGHLRLSTEDVSKLQVELHKWSIWASGGRSASMTPQGTPQSLQAADQGPAHHSRRGSPFTWGVPRQPNADRNRQRFRIGLAIVVALLALGIALSQWSEGFAAVAFSMFTPVLLLLLGFGLDRAYSIGTKFRIDSDGSTLTAVNGSRTVLSVPLSSVESFRVDSSSQTLHTQGTTRRRTEWHVIAEGPQEPSRALIPRGFGSQFSQDEAIHLERELNQLL